MYSGNGTLRLMCILAHPDDESLGTGGTLARYAAEGIETYVITATRGQRGWFGPPEENPGLAALGQIREAELRAAAQALGVKELVLLDYVDGDLDRAEKADAIRQLVAHLRRVRPHVVVTFDPFGVYGHPDHIAICQLTTAAVQCAANCDYPDPSGAEPHSVAKLYYMADTQDTFEIYTRVFGDLVMVIDGVERRVMPWPAWSITTAIDTAPYRAQVWDAVKCHQTQIREYQKLLDLPDEDQLRLWCTNKYYRVFSQVPAAGGLETDLFDGLRHLSGDSHS